MKDAIQLVSKYFCWDRFVGGKKEVEIEELLEKDGRILDTLVMKHDFEMGIVGSDNVEDVGEVGGVANEL